MGVSSGGLCRFLFRGSVFVRSLGGGLRRRCTFPRAHTTEKMGIPTVTGSEYKRNRLVRMAAGCCPCGADLRLEVRDQDVCEEYVTLRIGEDGISIVRLDKVGVGHIRRI
jgi:hypothetical protein